MEKQFWKIVLDTDSPPSQYQQHQASQCGSEGHLESANTNLEITLEVVAQF
jgi:hypothetical protein